MIEVFERHRPDVVFHAAAYKHVPLLEASPVEGVATNVLGTKCVVDAARRVGVRALRPLLDGQGRRADERARPDEGCRGVDRRRGRPRARGRTICLDPSRQRRRLGGEHRAGLPPAGRTRRPGHGHASGRDSLPDDRGRGGGARDRRGRRWPTQTASSGSTSGRRYACSSSPDALASSVSHERRHRARGPAPRRTAPRAPGLATATTSPPRVCEHVWRIDRCRRSIPPGWTTDSRRSLGT